MLLPPITKTTTFSAFNKFTTNGFTHHDPSAGNGGENAGAKWPYQVDQQNGNDVVSLPRASVGSGCGANSEASPSSGSMSNEESSNDKPTNGSSNGAVSVPSTNSASSANSSKLVSATKSKPLVVTPEQVMKLYSYKLTPYEHREIFNYSELYFIGANAIKRMGIIGGANNNDYDDEQGSYM